MHRGDRQITCVTGGSYKENYILIFNLPKFLCVKPAADSAKMVGIEHGKPIKEDDTTWGVLGGIMHKQLPPNPTAFE